MAESDYAAERRERNRRYYQRHREEILSKRKIYRDKNRERIRAYNREYQAEYREGILRRGEHTEEN